MPMPATKIPDGAVTGDDMRLRPYRKRNAAARSVIPIASCEIVANMTVPQSFFVRWAFALPRFACLVLWPLTWNIASMRSVTA